MLFSYPSCCLPLAGVRGWFLGNVLTILFFNYKDHPLLFPRQRWTLVAYVNSLGYKMPLLKQFWIALFYTSFNSKPNY